MTLERILSAAKSAMCAPNAKRAPHCYSAHVQGRGYVNDGSILDTRADYLRQLASSVQSEIDNIGWAEGYAEPGYDAPRNGVVLANWNVFPRDFDRVLERAGYAIEWSDEWSTCDSCNRIVRTSADSYGWTRSYYLANECEIICKDCATEDEDEYVTSYLLNQSDHADTFGIDLAAHGFTRHNADSFENGFHPGQNDTPRDIVAKLPAGLDYVFTIDDKAQFDIRFSVWTRPVDVDEEA
jgi:hypothetical protein